MLRASIRCADAYLQQGTNDGPAGVGREVLDQRRRDMERAGKDGHRAERPNGVPKHVGLPRGSGLPGGFVFNALSTLAPLEFGLSNEEIVNVSSVDTVNQTFTAIVTQ